MKFKLSKSSDWDYKHEIEFNTLEDLINFVDKLGENIIIFPKDDDGYEIEIYDYWRE